MCGICVFIHEFHGAQSKVDLDLLNSRGPDFRSSHISKLDNQIELHFYSSVLWLQGEELCNQPIIDGSKNVLLWNGDILNCHEDKISKSCSDTKYLSQKLEETESIEQIVEILECIRGPWCLIYFQISSGILFFGQDVLGRHSLLWSKSMDGKLKSITSVAKRNSSYEEVPAMGLYFVKLDSNLLELPIHLIPWSTVNLSKIKSNIIIENRLLKSPLITSLSNEDIKEKKESIFDLSPTESIENQLGLFSETLSSEVTEFLHALNESMIKRIKAHPSVCKLCSRKDTCSHSKFAVLFSGGLDSAILASLLSSNLVKDEPIDLLNVSFEMKNSKNENGTTKFETPDRITGKTCYKQLQSTHPERCWNFVEINVTAKELQEERCNVIQDLIAPLTSVLDDSIGCALYFCAKGQGLLNEQCYTTPARVVFSGLGADEQLGGYSRHKSAFDNRGWPGLFEEVSEQISSLPSRNLARDNRVIAHHGRAPRYPYLDENVISLLNSYPLWKKMQLSLPRGVGDKILLRFVALRLGLSYSAKLPKRAIQFGSRIAKLENSKEKGNQACSRLMSCNERR